MRSLFRASILVVALAVGMLSCAVQFDAAAVREAIEASNDAFVKAYNSGDIAGVGALYTENAILLPNDQRKVEGRLAIQEYYAKAFSAGLSGLKLEIVSVNGCGELAYEIGRYSVMLPREEEKIEWAGKYLVIWERQADGAWMMSVDMANNDGPVGKE